MKTDLTNIAEQLEDVDRGCLPYAPDDKTEILVCDAALADLDKIIVQADRIRKEIETRRAEFFSLLVLSK